MTAVSTIKDNAVLSIRLAVDDYKTGDPGRTISALRNITAGILLLYKEKLLRLSPPGSEEVLIKKRILPKLQGNKLVFVGSGKTTVDRQEIQERFKSLNINVNWNRTEKILDLRNEIEHYRSDQVPSVMREVFGSAFFVIDEFCREHLDAIPYDLFGADVWEVFLEEERFLTALQASIEESNRHIQWATPDMKDVACHFKCAGCGSGLLRVKDCQADYESLEYHCLTCGRDNSFDELIEDALAEAYYTDIYLTFKDIGEHYLEECGNCWKDSFIPSEGHCVVCGHKPYKVCENCGSEYTLDQYCKTCDFEAGRLADEEDLRP